MAMHNPPHPGEFIREVYLEPHSMTGRHLASKLGVSPSTLNRILQGVALARKWRLACPKRLAVRPKAGC